MKSEGGDIGRARAPGILDFAIIGAQKSGTTSLFDALTIHPSLCMPLKEIHWFSKTHSQRSQADYDATFRPEPGQLCGEASTSYTMLPNFTGVPERMHRYNPAMKLIYLVRNPVDRAESHLAHQALRRPVDGPFELDIVSRSRYHYQVSAFLEWFPRDQLLIIGMEQLMADVPGVLRRVTDFLGVPFHDVDGFPHANRSAGELMFMPYRYRRVFNALPQPVRIRLRPYLSRRRSFNADRVQPRLSEAERRELWRMLVGDMALFSQLAPEVVGSWLDDPSLPVSCRADLDHIMPARG